MFEQLYRNTRLLTKAAYKQIKLLSENKGTSFIQWSLMVYMENKSKIFNFNFKLTQDEEAWRGWLGGLS